MGKGQGTYVHCHGLEWLAKPVKVVFSRPMLMQLKAGVWRTCRVEYVSTTDETGRKIIETKVFFQKDRCGAYEIYPDPGERRLLVGILNGRVAIDRVTVRRMERVR